MSLLLIIMCACVYQHLCSYNLLRLEHPMQPAMDSMSMNPDPHVSGKETSAGQSQVQFLSLRKYDFMGLPIII